MSYILEALKKSQEERELGRVPTLDTNLFATVDGSVRTHPWSLLAVGLAMLAVIIALYAALRGNPLLPRSVDPVQPSAQVSAPAAPAAAPQEPPEADSAPPDSSAASAPAVAEEGSPDVAEEVAELPPPRAAVPARSRLSGADAAIPPRPQRTPVPDDVRAEIEAFKQEVMGVPPAPERPAQPGTGDVAPDALRLPGAVEARLPAFLMTVHVYDDDPAKRFVLINALKTREGERTREGLVVEEILPDGAVLSFEGHPFYRHH